MNRSKSAVARIVPREQHLDASKKNILSYGATRPFHLFTSRNGKNFESVGPHRAHVISPGPD